jgi:hypothetical protein
MSDRVQEVAQRVEQQRELAATRLQQLQQADTVRLGRDRSWIAFALLAAYAIVMLAFVGYFWHRTINCQDDVFDNAFDVVKVAVMPLLTLILGFYFGSSSR